MKQKPVAAAVVATRKHGYVVRVMNAEERSADMKEFGKEIRKNKASAIAFLQRAGILDDTGSLAAPYRA